MKASWLDLSQTKCCDPRCHARNTFSATDSLNEGENKIDFAQPRLCLSCAKLPNESAFDLSRICSAVFGLKGRHRPAQGKAKRRSPRSVALGIDESITVALKGQNNEPHPARYSTFARYLRVCVALSGLRIPWLTNPGRRSAAIAASLCPGLVCHCPFRAKGNRA